MPELRRNFVHISFFVMALVFSAFSEAATFYIDSVNGNDANDGRTPSTSWRSLRMVGARQFSQGDDVLLRSGSRFENQSIYIGWGGSESNWMMLDCYRLDTSGNPFNCTSVDPKPEINGTFQTDCASARQCAYDNASAVPSSIWGALVAVEANYVSVRNISVRDSAGYPVLFNSSRDQPKHHFVLEDVTISHSFQGIAQVGRGYQHGVIRRVTATLFGLCEQYQYGPCSGGGWPSGIMVHDSPQAMILIENNLVHDGVGEGFACLRSSHVVFRNNRAGNVRSDGYYLDNCSNTIVENNIAWGDLGNKWGSGGHFSGISVATEDYPGQGFDSVNNIIRNNLVTGFGSCIASSQWPEAIQKGLKIGYHFYGNSCVAINDRNVSIFNSVKNLTNVLVKNNMFYSPAAKEGSCTTPESAAIKFESNLWDSLSRTSRCYGVGDLVEDPQILTPLADFAKFTASNQPQPRNFGLKPTSPLIARGTDFPSEELLNTANYGLFVNLLSDDRCEISEQPLSHDFYCASRQSPPTIGAIDKAKYAPRPPVVISGGN